MGRTVSSIDDATREFVQAQSMFFVATAPLDPNGHVNVSPKGLDTLRILDANTVAYLDLTGSGVETVAHVKENGRIVLMFCAFQGAPNILRLHGRARVVEPGQPEFDRLQVLFPHFESTRTIIVTHVTRVQDSCGFGVPLYRYEGERTQLQAWAKNRGSEGLKEYRRVKNQKSLDGLPGVEV